uniref:GG12539 n=2 Tax=Drosophila erecta TaxID=7220 RepID=B3P7N0_DROER
MESPQLKFLRELIDVFEQVQEIRTIMLIKHSQDRNCHLEQWNPRASLILRADEMGSIRISGYSNDQAVSLVCIGNDSDYGLLHSLANAMDNMRQERIILWSQSEPTKILLDYISQQANRYHFVQLTIVAMNDSASAVPALLRMNPYPTAQFCQLKNIADINEANLFERGLSFQGRTAILRESVNSNIRFNVRSPSGFIPLSELKDYEIVQFAIKYNLSLKLYEQNDTKSDHFDIQLGPRFITQDFPTQMAFVSPNTACSLIVIVPCSQKWRLMDVLHKLGVLKLICCLLIAYVLFVLIETLILWLTHRISDRGSRLTSLSPLLNPRAFRGILGLPFPEFRRSSVSLRQLFLVISVFGLVFSNFVSCKLSALLMKPAQNPQVRNFEELRDSGLITITDEYTHYFIKTHIDTEFFNRVLPHYLIAKKKETLRMLMSFNDSYSYIMYTPTWKLLNTLQRSLDERVFCESESLSIAWNLPRMYVLENNSALKWMLTRFINYIPQTGIPDAWNGVLPNIVKLLYNVTFPPKIAGTVPLSIHHLSWIWHLLVIGESIATLVFVVEILLRKRNRSTSNLSERPSYIA